MALDRPARERISTTWVEDTLQPQIQMPVDHAEIYNWMTDLGLLTLIIRRAIWRAVFAHCCVFTYLNDDIAHDENFSSVTSNHLCFLEPSSPPVRMKFSHSLALSGLLASVSAVPMATGPSGKWFDRKQKTETLTRYSSSILTTS